MNEEKLTEEKAELLCVIKRNAKHLDCAMYILEAVEKYMKAASSKEVESGAVKIVEDLAAWSKKYPRGTIYPMSAKENVDGQLIELEERAKKYVEQTKEVSNKPS